MITRRHTVAAALAASTLVLAACGSMMGGSAPMGAGGMSASLSARNEVPPNGSAATGSAKVNLDRSTKVLTWTVTYSGLTGPATGAHFHGPALPGANAAVVVPFTGPIASPITGTATLTDAQMADLSAGRWYINIHTAANPGGEIRGQVQ